MPIIFNSGDVDNLSDRQWELVDGSIAFYRECAGIIRDGVSYRYGPEVLSYAHPEGYQIVVRIAGNRAMAVVHTFEYSGEIRENVPVLGGFRLADCWGDKNIKLCLEQGSLCIDNMEDFDGLLLLFQRS